jgi:predicted nucleic acid-binding protein
MSKVARLDVNVLIALHEPDHVHHEIAHDWWYGCSRIRAFIPTAWLSRTFDRAILWNAIVGAEPSLVEVVSAVDEG